jgi:hypothetical protein
VARISALLVFGFLATGFLFLGADISESHAEEEAKEEVKEEIAEPETLKKGVVASFGQYQKQAGVDHTEQPTIGEGDDEVQVVSGSISRLGRTKCQAVITNSSKEYAYFVRFKAIGSTHSGTKAFSKSLSGLAPAGGRLTRQFSCGEGLNLRLEITSGRRR